MRRRVFRSCFLVLCVSLLIGCQPESEMSYLENGVIKVGVELLKGGTITFLADANHLDVNLLNSHDMGRMIQQSY